MHAITSDKKEAVYLKESVEIYREGFGGRKEKQ